MPTFDPVIINEKLGRTVILECEDGTEVVGVIVDSEKVFTADENDIRQGKIAATDKGVTEGKKVIPSYHTETGYKLVPNGNNFEIQFANELFDFTKLQVIICPFSGSIAGSVAAEKIAIDETVYPVNSVETFSTVTRDTENKKINLGFTNESGSLYLIRYFTYKEIY